MKTYEAGQPAGSGLYVSFHDWDLQIVSDDGERLEGEGHRYMRIPLLMMVALSPLIGGLYAMAFPLVIFGAFLKAFKEELGAFRSFRTGETVGWGVYVGLNRLCVSYVSASEESLDGEPDTRFLRVPTWMVLLGSPIIGGLYVVLFPFLLGGALLTVLLGLVAAPFRKVSEQYGNLTASHWEPTAAYLDRPKAEGDEDAEDELADLAQEVEQRRSASREDDEGSAS